MQLGPKSYLFGGLVWFGLVGVWFISFYGSVEFLTLNIERIFNTDIVLRLNPFFCYESF